jgi:hypothetical protein
VKESYQSEKNSHSLERTFLKEFVPETTHVAGYGLIGENPECLETGPGHMKHSLRKKGMEEEHLLAHHSPPEKTAEDCLKKIEIS